MSFKTTDEIKLIEAIEILLKKHKECKEEALINLPKSLEVSDYSKKSFKNPSLNFADI